MAQQKGMYPNLPSSPPAYGPPPTHQPSVVVTAAAAVGPNSQTLVCPSCHASVKTEVRTKATTRTHIIALLLCLFCCWPCICVPYCIDSCQNVDHFCPSCKTYLGTYSG